jgi:hypothetical protein
MEPLHILVILVVVLLFLGGRRPGSRSGPPTHPLPVTSSTETSRGSGDAEEKRHWHALLRFIGPPGPSAAAKR